MDGPKRTHRGLKILLLRYKQKRLLFESATSLEIPTQFENIKTFTVNLAVSQKHFSLDNFFIIHYLKMIKCFISFGRDINRICDTSLSTYSLLFNSLDSFCRLSGFLMKSLLHL